MTTTQPLPEHTWRYPSKEEAQAALEEMEAQETPMAGAYVLDDSEHSPPEIEVRRYTHPHTGEHYWGYWWMHHYYAGAIHAPQDCQVAIRLMDNGAEHAARYWMDYRAIDRAGRLADW